MPDQPPAGKTELPNAETEPRNIEAKPRAGISRREFALRAALASAVASIAPVAAVVASSGAVNVPLGSGDSIPQDRPATSPPTAVVPQSPGANTPRLSAESQAEADARFQTILVVYGSRFSDEQKMDLHRLCSVSQPALDHIRAYKIENGDGPGLYLKPGYEREKKVKVANATAKSPAGPSAPAAKAAVPAGGAKKP